MLKILCVFIGGGLGSLCRYGIGQMWGKCSLHFPWPTFLTNLLGCLLIGLLAGYLLRRQATLPYLLMVTGFCGGFTTFSTFSSETVLLLRNGLYATAFWYVLLSIVLGLSLTALGYLIVERL